MAPTSAAAAASGVAGRGPAALLPRALARASSGNGAARDSILATRASKAALSQRGSSPCAAGARGALHLSFRGRGLVGQCSAAAQEVKETQHDNGVQLDSKLERELKENGPRSTLKSKMICTIGPASSSPEMLEKLAAAGMNVARLNFTHADQAWHAAVIDRIRQLNAKHGYSVAIMADTEGSEIHTLALAEPVKAEEGDHVVFTVRNPAPPSLHGIPTVSVSYDSFVEDVAVGDSIVVDGGMSIFEVEATAGPDVRARCIDAGIILSRANLTFRRGGELLRGRSSALPVISAKDWQDIDFAIAQGVDFLAISFVKNAEILKNLRSYIQTRSPDKAIGLVAKIEAVESLSCLDDIIAASDGVMVARGDLGAQVAPEEVPGWQEAIVRRARQLGRASIVAAQLLQSMLEHPVPTRAEVADVADCVRQQADALMLSSESAVGRHPEKALGVLRSVAVRMESSLAAGEERTPRLPLPPISTTSDGAVSEEVCAAAAGLAERLGAAAIVCFTRRGYMAEFLSRNRPLSPVFALTDRPDVRSRLELCYGVIPLRVSLRSEDPEANVQGAFELLKARGWVKSGDLTVVVSDVRARAASDAATIVRGVQVRRVP